MVVEARRRRRPVLVARRAPARGGRRCSGIGSRPDRHLPSRDPRRARRQGRAGRSRGNGHRSRSGLARRRAACARHPARVRPRRGPGTVRSPDCWPHSGRGHDVTEAIPTPASCKRRRTVVVLGAGIAGLTAAQELAERGFDVTVYELRTDERYGARAASRRGICTRRSKLGGLAASQYSTVGPYTGSLAQLRPFPDRRGNPRDPGTGGRGRARLPFLPGLLHTHLGPVPTNPGLRAHRSGSRRDPLATDLTHDHGQRQAGGHPGHHGRRQAVARLPARGATQPRRIPHHRSASSRHWASPRWTSRPS